MKSLDWSYSELSPLTLNLHIRKSPGSEEKSGRKVLKEIKGDWRKDLQQSMIEQRGTCIKVQPHLKSSTNPNTPLKMANQTEDSSRRRIKIQGKALGSSNSRTSPSPPTANPGPSNPPTTAHNPETVVDHNNNVQIPGQRHVILSHSAPPSLTIPNERKRSSDEGTARGFMKRFKWTLGLALVFLVLPVSSEQVPPDFGGTLMVFILICSQLMFECDLQSIRGEPPGNQLQNWDRPSGMPKIAQLEVMCGAQHMEVHLNFDAPFHGLVASKGMYGQPGCVYVPPR